MGSVTITFSINENVRNVIFDVPLLAIWRYDASDGSWRSEWLPYKTIGVWGPWCTTELWRASYISQTLAIVSFIRRLLLFFLSKRSYKINIQTNVFTRFLTGLRMIPYSLIFSLPLSAIRNTKDGTIHVTKDFFL